MLAIMRITVYNIIIIKFSAKIKCSGGYTLERIYTIPVNEKFDSSARDASHGCPFCALFNMLEANETELILGASMMEPDVRIKTNADGFCKIHYSMLFQKNNRLSLSLILESHLAEHRDDIARAPAPKQLAKLEESCYICARVAHHFSHMTETAVLLWDKDANFREKLKHQPYFCLPHYRSFTETAKGKLCKKDFAVFYSDIRALELSYYDAISEEIKFFCKKFDYRYGDEPWNGAKDAPERVLKFISGDMHRSVYK